MMNDQGYDGYRGELNRQSVTIAEVLRPAGYRTYMTGKYHVTTATDGKNKSNWPLHASFEKYYGTITGAGNFFDPNTLVRQNEMITAATDAAYKPKSYYYTDAISDNSVEFLKQHQTESPDKPFFMYVAYTAAHWPMHAPEEEIAKFKGKIRRRLCTAARRSVGEDERAGVGSERDRTLAAGRGLEQVEHKAWEARCMEVYAAMISRMDTGIGRIVAQLKQSGQLDNTLILFLQDNGGCAEAIGRQDGKESKQWRGKSGPEQYAGTPRIRLSRTAAVGRMSATRRFASTSTGRTKEASRRRSSRIGRAGLANHNAANSNANRRT